MLGYVSSRFKGCLGDEQFVLAIERSQVAGHHLIKLDRRSYALSEHWLLSGLGTCYVKQPYKKHEGEPFHGLILS